MPLRWKTLFGALIIGTFITACVGWLFYGAGKPVPGWGYPLVFVIFVTWLYTVGRLLIGGETDAERARSFDVSIEGQ